MSDLFSILLQSHNIVYTFLMVLVIIYWLTVIIGGLDIDSIDFDFGGDADVDVDLDAEGSWLDVLSFGKIPFMVVFSLLVLWMWVGNFAFFELQSNKAWWVVLVMAIPLFCVSILITRVICIPLIPLFENLNQYLEEVDYVGMTGIVKVPMDAENRGQIKITLPNLSTLLVSAKAAVPNKKIDVGQEVQVVALEKEDLVLVKPILHI